MRVEIKKKSIYIPFATVPSDLEFAASANKETSFRWTIVSGCWQRQKPKKIWHIQPPLHA